MPIRFIHYTGVTQTVLKLDLSSAPNLPFSFACFFEPESTWTAADKCLIQIGVAGGIGDSFRLDLSSARTVKAKSNDFVYEDVSHSTELFNFNEWNHGAAVFAGSGAPGSNPPSGITVYCNGVAGATVAGSATITPDNTSWLFIGGRSPTSSGTRGFPGCMAHVALWNIALSAGQVALLAAGTRPDDHSALGTSAPDLVGYWEFIDAATAETATAGSNLTLDDSPPYGIIQDCEGDPIPAGNTIQGHTRVIGF